MRTLTLAGLFVLALATAAFAGIGGASSYGNNSLDPNGLASVTVNSPSYSTVASSERPICLDSSCKWAVNDIKVLGSPSMNTKVEKGMHEKGQVYCFDSGSRFCAKGF